MYVVELTFTQPVEEVAKQVEAHLDYLDKHYAQKHFIASGAKNPRDGGVILARASLSREQLEAILEEDPFKQHQLADYRIIDFVADKYDPAIASLI